MQGYGDGSHFEGVSDHPAHLWHNDDTVESRDGETGKNGKAIRQTSGTSVCDSSDLASRLAGMEIRACTRAL